MRSKNRGNGVIEGGWRTGCGQTSEGSDNSVSALMFWVMGPWTKLVLQSVQYCSERLRPGSPCCNTCTWAKVSSKSRIQRNYKGLKLTTYMHS